MTLSKYVDCWAKHLDAVHRYTNAELDELFSWLVEQDMASDAADRAAFAATLIEPGRDQVTLRPSITVELSWKWSDVLELDDDRERLVIEVRTALSTVLQALDEPPLAAESD